MARVAIRGLWHEAMFRRLLAVRVLGQFQDGIIQSALAGFVLFSPESQNSPAAVVAAFAVLLLPYSVIGPFVGVFLDRWRRRQVLLVANLVRAGMVVALAGLTLARAGVIPTGLLVLLVLGTNRLILTALAASLPRTVTPSHLVPANAVAPVAGTTAAAIAAGITVSIGASLGASRTTTAGLLTVAAVGLVVTALLSLRIPVERLGPEADRPRETFAEVVRQLVAGARTLRNKRPAWWAVLGLMPHRMAYGVALLLAIVASKSVLSPGSDARALGAFAISIAAAGIGAFLGAVATPPAARRWSAPAWSIAVMAVATVAVPVALLQVSVAGYAAAGLVLGFAGQSVKVGTDTIVALTVPDQSRGRVFSLVDVGVNVALLLGIAVAGALIPASGVSAALSASTTLLLAASAVLFEASRRALRSGSASVSDTSSARSDHER